jgi:hypothetical protein
MGRLHANPASDGRRAATPWERELAGTGSIRLGRKAEPVESRHVLRTIESLTTSAFDALEARWHAATTRRLVARLLIGAFLASVGLIELSRLEMLPEVFGHPMPTNHFHAISWVVTLLLIVEVLDLIFGLAGSMSRAIGKQLEIFSLVLLRKTFDELPQFPEPLVIDGHLDALVSMGAQAGGALLVFAMLIAYYRTLKHQPLSADPTDLASFIATKKAICLLLLVAFAVIGAVAGVRSLTLDHADATLSLHFFELFYTIMVFADILVVLASLSATLGYAVVFRNFGFAVVTVTIRLGLTAKPWLNAVLGVIAALFALAISHAYTVALSGQERDFVTDEGADHASVDTHE